MGSTKYTKNENYFSETNIKNCYWMGYIAADGNIFYGKKGLKSLQFHIKSTDRILLESFKKDIEYTGIIRESQSLPYIFKENNKSRHPIGYILPSVSMIFLQINNSGVLFGDLEKHANISKCKSDTLLPPNFVSFAEKIAYITGYFDGDGSLFWHKQSKVWRMNIIGTKELIEWIIETIQPFIDNKIYISKDGRKETNTWKLRIETTKGTQQFLDLMSCAVYSPLRRKHDFEEYWKARGEKTNGKLQK